MLYDSTAADSLRNLDKFRQKFNFLYLCKSCTRSFDSMEPLSRCKFCSAEGPEVLDMKTSKEIYRYYCPNCEKNRLSEVHVENCARCGNKFIHLYKWGKKSRSEFTRMRARNIFGKAKGRASNIGAGLKDAISGEG